MEFAPFGLESAHPFVLPDLSGTELLKIQDVAEKDSHSWFLLQNCYLRIQCLIT